MRPILPVSIALLFLFAPAFQSIAELIPNQQDIQNIPFHTPVYTEGKSLPEHIIQSMTVGPEDGIILIHKIITVHFGTTLTIKPGTTVAIAEYGGIRVFGTLTAQGTEENPIQFISNEKNEVNRNWSGILFESTGNGTIKYAVFHHASPAMSCATPGKVLVQNTSYLFGNLDLYDAC
ncbi:MAG TPA: hypothetical protein VJI96_05280 [Candidatus Andersenbacteria bacterium]|nr:hypothetical protein [Candidatus Andersenbacteria bacterium]